MAEQCPVCCEKMAVKRFEDKEFFECIYCWSHWIPSSDLAKYLHEKTDLEQYVNEVTHNISGLGKGTCPSCSGQRLSKTQFKGVELDYCEGCGGTLFDHGELKGLYKELFNIDFDGIAEDVAKVSVFVRLVRTIFDGLS